MGVVGLATTAAAVASLAVALPLAAMSAPWRRFSRASAEPVKGAGSGARRHADVAAVPALEILPTGVVVLEPSGAVAFANGAATELGLVDGNHLREQAMVEQARATGQDGETRDARYDVRLRRPSRRRIPVALRTVPLDEPGAVALLATDMTEADRLEAVRRDFIANVGHELKTPVGALSLLAEAVVASAEDPEAVQRFGERMIHEAHRLGRLVTEVIELSRLQAGDPLPEVAPVSVDEVIREAVDRSRLGAEDRAIKLVIAEPSGLFVRGYEPQLVTALVNLLDNAIAYSPEGSPVGLGVRGGRDEVEISVSDNGIGIAREDQQRIFERFFRVDAARSRATGGTGLGLAIVKHIVTNHGGDVRLWSSPGSGSTFTLILPLAPEPAEGEDTGADRGDPASRARQPEQARRSDPTHQAHQARKASQARPADRADHSSEGMRS